MAAAIIIRSDAALCVGPNSLCGCTGDTNATPTTSRCFPLHRRLSAGSHVLVPRDRPVDTGVKLSISEAPVVFIHLSDADVLPSRPWLLGCTALALGPLFPAFNLRDIQAVVVSMMILFAHP